jgi:hypothetical protein
MVFDVSKKRFTTVIPQYINDYFDLPYTDRHLKDGEAVDTTDGLKIIKKEQQDDDSADK